MITVAPTGAELEKSAVPALPVTLEELVTTAKECREAGAAIIHVHIRDGERAADSGPVQAEGHRARAARVDRPDRAALDRRRGHRPVRTAARGTRRGTGRLLADLRDGELRRRRLHEPVAVHVRAVRQDAGARRGARVRAVRPGARRRVAPAARQVRPAVRRARALRPGHGSSRRDAGRRGDAGPGRGGTAGRSDLVGDRGGPDLAAGDVRRARGRRAAAGRDGGHDHVLPRPAGAQQRRARRAGRDAGRAGSAARDDAGPGQGDARSSRSARGAAPSRASPSTGRHRRRGQPGARRGRQVRGGRVVASRLARGPRRGRLGLLAAGAPTGPMFPRSSNKPMQAAAMLRCGLDLDGKLLALAAASHSGEEFHVAGVREILRPGRADRGRPAVPAATCRSTTRPRRRGCGRAAPPTGCT